MKHPYKYKDIISNLAKKEEICFLKQDKGKGIVIMDKSKYIAKCEEFLNGERFINIETDPTARFETKVQNLLLSMKDKFDTRTYYKLYPSGSRPGLFYGTAKMHKLPEDSKNVDNLPVRPIVSSIGTATYETSKYLANLLAPLAKSKYTVDSSKEFISRIRDKTINEEFELVSFDVISLFTNVPLDYTINVILDKVYDQNRIKTKLKREEMRALLNICTKEMHFSLNNKIYKQTDGVCMGNPLGPVIANIFMVELESKIVPTISDIMPEWIRYVDDTLTFVKRGELNKVLTELNNFHEDIKFTHETENKKSISFLDVKLTRVDNGTLRTCVYRKETSSNIYIGWNSFAPRTWKIGTLHGLIQRAFTICSETEEREKEIRFLKKIFSEVNGYPLKVIDNTIQKVRRKNEGTQDNVHVVETTEDDGVREEEKEVIHRPHMSLPYGGDKGNNLVKKFKHSLHKMLPKNVKPEISVKGKKLYSYFPIKDKVADKHTKDYIYKYKCKSYKKCKSDYVGETGRRKEKRIKEHGHTDVNSAIYKHSRKEKHAQACEENFSIIGKNYPHWRRRKICEAMFIRDEKPKLNKQIKSHKLVLFK